MKTTREKLLNSAKNLLWQVGYEAMSPRKILKESGAGQGSFYHHFTGKFDLAATALNEVEQEMKDNFAKAFDENLAPLARVQKYLTTPRNGLKGCRLGRLANEESIVETALHKPVSRYFSFIEKKIEVALSEAIELGELPAQINPANMAISIVATIQGGYIMSRIHRDPDHINKATANVAALLGSLKVS